MPEEKTMKVLLIVGSPHKKNSTNAALTEAARGLKDNGIETEIAWIGDDPIKPCTACGACGDTQRCIFGDDDVVNELIDKLQAADGLIVGSPVYYAGINGALKSVLDRMFFAASSTYAYKPAASLVCVRRGGSTSALDQINKFFLISQMPVVSSFYWPMVYGNNPEQVAQDIEGMQCAYQLGVNMTWLLKSLEAGKAAGIKPVRPESRAWTNFIR
jgi:multimeric flavodoxin WrbA